MHSHKGRLENLERGGRGDSAGAHAQRGEAHLEHPKCFRDFDERVDEHAASPETFEK